MADKKGLEIVGVAFGLVTAIVVMVGGIVVKGHLDGRLSMEARSEFAPIASVATGAIIR